MEKREVDYYEIAVDMLIDTCEYHIHELNHLTNQFRDIQTDDEEFEEYLKTMVDSLAVRMKVVRKFEKK